MAYIKLEGDLDDGVSIEEAQTKESALVDFMVSVSTITGHCDAIRKILRTLPVSTAREIAEMKVKEAEMWGHQAFIGNP